MRGVAFRRPTGTTVYTQFLQADLVDEIQFAIAPFSSESHQLPVRPGSGTFPDGLCTRMRLTDHAHRRGGQGRSHRLQPASAEASWGREVAVARLDPVGCGRLPAGSTTERGPETGWNPGPGLRFPGTVTGWSGWVIRRALGLFPGFSSTPPGGLPAYLMFSSCGLSSGGVSLACSPVPGRPRRGRLGVGRVVR